eukprot:403355955
MKFMFIYLTELIVMMIIYMTFQIYKFIDLNGNYVNLQYVGLSISLLFIVATLQCILSRKYQWISLNIANIQTLCMFVALIESGANGNPTFAQVDLFAVLTGLISTLSFMSYLIKEREKFKSKQNQKQMLQMFQNLMTTHHDGIIISEDQDILFYNDQIDKIFDNQKHRLSTSNDPKKKQIYKNIQKQKVKESLINTIFKKDKNKTNKDSENQEISLIHYENIWEYILTNLRNYLQILPKDGMDTDLNQKDPKMRIEGAYFTYSQKQGKKLQKKKLQVFTSYVKSGPKNYVLTTIRDMSFWLEYQKEKNMSSMKTIAFASAAHEFRNPLNAIISSLELLDPYVKNERAEKFLKTAKISSNLMLYLMNDILDFSQIEAKNFILNIQQTNIQDCLEEIINILEFKAKTKNIGLSYQVKGQNVPKEIFTDLNRIKQILINLVSNGIKYTLEGSVQIIVKFDKENNFILFNVKDTGVGISIKQHAKLFSAFTKIMKNRDLNREGCGLGLQVSKNLANAMGGNIEFKSQVGKGSLFVLSLPIFKTKEELLLALQIQQGQRSSSQTPQIQEDSKFFAKPKSIVHSLLSSFNQESMSIECNEEIESQTNENLQQNINLYLNDMQSMKEKQLNSMNFQFNFDSSDQIRMQSFKKNNHINAHEEINRNVFIDKESIQERSINHIDLEFQNDQNINEKRSPHSQYDKDNNFFTSRWLLEENQPDKYLEFDKHRKILKNSNQYPTASSFQTLRIKQSDVTQYQQTILRNQSFLPQSLSISQRDLDHSPLNPQECQCPKILIVDDEPFNLIALEGILEQQGITKVEKAFNGRDGFDKYIRIKRNLNGYCKAGNHEQNCLKIVISDYNMPIMNGYQMVTAIRDEGVDISQTIFILISGDIFSGQLSNQLNEAFDYIITKPISNFKVKELINQYINN